jgi:hypothetical protein
MSERGPPCFTSSAPERFSQRAPADKREEKEQALIRWLGRHPTEIKVLEGWAWRAGGPELHNHVRWRECFAEIADDLVRAAGRRGCLDELQSMFMQHAETEVQRLRAEAVAAEDGARVLLELGGGDEHIRRSLRDLLVELPTVTPPHLEDRDGAAVLLETGYSARTKTPRREHPTPLLSDGPPFKVAP